MKRAIQATCVFVCLVTTSLARAQSPIDVTGDWSGVLRTPIGDLSLIVSITRDDSGALRGEMESPDQGPGRNALTTITASGDRLAFTIAAAQIAYEATWIESDGHWAGVFRHQGAEMPLTLARGQPPARPVIDGLDGVWEGRVTRNGVRLRLRLRVVTTPRGTVAVFDSLDQGALGLPVTDLRRAGAGAGFTVPASGARFDGMLSEDATRMSGPWTVPGQPDVEIEFVRARATAAREMPLRPQTPQGPYPYHVEDVRFGNPFADGVTLAGTLTRPDGTPPFPAAILISGSGPQDRDETLFGHKPFAVLADYLTRRGVAVLRYDDRGVGQSTGDFMTATSADFATDARAAVRYLSTRPEIAGNAIGFVGHSEGGMVAPIAAVDEPGAAFLVLLAGPGTDIRQLLLSQQRLLGLSQGMSAEAIARLEPVMTALMAAVAAAPSADDAGLRARAAMTPEAVTQAGLSDAQKEVLLLRMSSPWYHYFLRYDPALVLSRVEVPVLALNGSLDRQVAADENLAGIRMALASSPDVTIRRLEGLNHLFQTATTGAIGEYADIPETVSPRVLDIVAEWILARFGR